jgi:hypothetical protein
MVYWSDVDTRRNKGSIYYRQSTSAADLDKAQTEINHAFPTLDTNLSWLFIATWYEVAFRGACQGYPEIRNTYQAILATDKISSFVLLFFNNITWTTGHPRPTLGNCSGLGGKPAKVGVDAGDGINIFNVPGSCTESIINVTHTTNVFQAGKWVFRVDEPTISQPEPVTTTTEESSDTTEITTSTTEPPSETTDAPPVAEPCYDTNDLVIVLDSSGSIGQENYELAKTFVLKLALAYTLHEQNRIGFIIFSSKAQGMFDLKKRLTDTQMIKIILGPHYLGETTRTNEGIKLAETYFTAAPRDFPKVWGR